MRGWRQTQAPIGPRSELEESHCPTKMGLSTLSAEGWPTPSPSRTIYWEPGIEEHAAAEENLEENALSTSDLCKGFSNMSVKLTQI